MSDISNTKYLTIVPYMPKGGVGKTTTTAHLGYALSEYGKTLVIDADPQGNLTNHLINSDTFNSLNKTLLDYFNKNLSFENSVIEARSPNNNFKGLYLLGTPNNSPQLQEYIQSKFLNNPAQLKNLKKDAISNGFKFILFDPPASFNFYTRFIITLSNHVIPIIQPESFGFDAFIDLYRELEEIKVSYDCDFSNKMAVINKNDPRNATHRHYLQQIQESPFKPLFVINDSKAIPFSCGQSILLQEYKPDNPANIVFNEIAKYFINFLENN